MYLTHLIFVQQNANVKLNDLHIEKRSAESLKKVYKKFAFHSKNQGVENGR